MIFERKKVRENELEYHINDIRIPHTIFIAHV